MRIYGEYIELFDTSTNNSNTHNDTIAYLSQQAFKYSGITALGFFAAFFFALFLTSRWSFCCVGAFFGLVGCECSVCEGCCDDADLSWVQESVCENAPLLTNIRLDHKTFMHTPLAIASVASNIVASGLAETNVDESITTR